MKGLLKSIICLGVLTLVSCQTDVVRPLEMGTEYSPTMNIGSWWEYEVDSTYVDDFFDPPRDTTIQFRLLEVYSDTIYDNSGRLSYIIDRYKKFYNDSIPYDSMQWKHNDVWFCTLTDNTFERVEENIRYVRLNFPVKEEREWDGNVYNTFQEWTYVYNNVDLPLTLTNGASYDSTLTVNQRDILNIIDKERAYEVYAKNVGLIKKVFTDQVLDINTGEPKSGPSVTWELIDYGF